MPIIQHDFFNCSGVLVAKALLGKSLVRKINGKTLRLIITETEAYDGYEDEASHAYKGQTERNKIMFGPAGNLYIYLVYGFHLMLNVVTGERGYPSAVLIRGGLAKNGELINGPGRLTRYLKIDKTLNGKVASRKNGLWFEDMSVNLESSTFDIVAGPRVGVHYAGSSAKKPYNFSIADVNSLKLKT